MIKTMLHEYDMGIKFTMHTAIDKVLESYGYETDEFFYDSDFDGPDLSKIVEQVVEWAEHHQRLLDEEEILLKEELEEETT